MRAIDQKEWDYTLSRSEGMDLHYLEVASAVADHMDQIIDDGLASNEGALDIALSPIFTDGSIDPFGLSQVLAIIAMFWKGNSETENKLALTVAETILVNCGFNARMDQLSKQAEGSNET